jgi:glycine betaine/proline transport system permease protein
MASADDWFAGVHVPAQAYVDRSFFWLSDHWRPFFQVVREPLAVTIDALGVALTALPPPLVLGVLFLVAWQANGLLSAGFVLTALLVVGVLGIWSAAMQTLALIFAAVVLCLAVGLPFGLAAARSDRLDHAMRPVLDLMQTLPAFVYLVPIVLLIGIGDLPGVLVTFVFAVPPIVRLTSLGIRNVPAPMVEAAKALGASPAQILTKVEIPNALPTILTGVNQTIMMALAMVTYASMIGVGGLGRLVLRGIGRLDMGLATVGGIGIVALAMIFSELVLTKRRHLASWTASPGACARALAARLGLGRRRTKPLPGPNDAGLTVVR